MQNLSKVSKFLLFLCSLAFILWGGTYFSKFFLLYQFYEPEMTLKTAYTNINFMPIFNTIMPIIGLNILFYPLFLLSLVLFSASSKLKIKNEGWFFIILSFSLITAPFEIYSLTYDYNIINHIYNGSNDAANILALIKEKIVSLGSFPFVQFLFIIAIVFLAVYKPLRKKTDEN
ncbi:MAG: hypothetical protein V1773_03640 [bacterium]